MLTEIDVMDDSSDFLQTQTFHPKRGQRFRTRSKQSPSKSDSGFSASDLSVQVRDLEKDGKPNWSCLSQYCALLSYKDTTVAVEVAKALKPLATLGSKHLKGELFRMVVLPCMLRCEGIFTEDVAEPLRKIRARSWTGSVRSEWLDQRTKSFRGSTFSGLKTELGSLSLTEQVHTDQGTCKEVLELCIWMLTSLLISRESRELFLNCGGLNELQSFLALPQLQEPVLHVLEFLGDVENQEASGKLLHADGGDLSAGSPETSGGDKSDSKVCCHSFLSLLQYTTTFVSETQKGSPGMSHVASCHPVESSLRVHVWISCLQLLVSNELFCELFLQDDGIVYSCELLHLLLEVFQADSLTDNTVEGDVNDFQYTKDLVSLFESVLAICIRMAHTEQWRNKEV